MSVVWSDRFPWSYDGNQHGSTFALISSLYQTQLSTTKEGKFSGSLTYVTKVERGEEGNMEFLPSKLDEILFAKVVSVLSCSTCHIPHPGRHIGSKLRGQ